VKDLKVNQTPARFTKGGNYGIRIFLEENLRKILKRSKVLLLIEIGIYIVVFSVFAILKYFSFHTYAFDLGIYNQELHSTLFGGRLLYSPLELLANPSGCLFGVHFSPILLVILPIYAIHPDPTTLLVFQTFVISLGALPLYLLASKRLSSEKWGLFFSTLYLLNPALEGINWYDFHPEAFLPTLFLFALYFFDAKKKAGYIASFFLALMCIEFASVVFIFMSLYFLVKMRPWKKDPTTAGRMWLLLLTILISFLWFIASLQTIHIFNQRVRPMPGEILWREIGANDLLDVPVQVVLHPARVINALLFDGWAKFAYVSILLGTVAFLPVFEPLIVICVFPWLVTALLSNFSPFYQFGDQYPAFVIAFLFYGAVLGMQKLQSSSNHGSSRKKVRMIAGILLCLSIMFCYISTPLNSKPYASNPYLSYGFPEISQHDRDVLKLLELLPPNASVLTQASIFPLLSNRVEAYLFPQSVHYPPGESFQNALYSLFAKVDFIVLDFRTDLIVAPIMLSYASNYGNFGTYASSDGSLILKRNFSGLPVFFQPINDTFDYKFFTLVNGQVVKDNDSMYGYAFMHSKSNISSDFWWGPAVFLPPGRYQATFDLKISNATEGELLYLYISRWIYGVSVEYLGTNITGNDLVFKLTTSENDNKVLTSRILSAKDFVTVNRYSSFTINFSVADFGAYEFGGATPSSRSDIFFDSVKLIQNEPSLNLTLQVHETFSTR
jgi:uncharacterized membrane protein